MTVLSPNISAVVGATGTGKTEFLFSKMVAQGLKEQNDIFNLYITDGDTPHRLKNRFKGVHNNIVINDTNIISYITDNAKMDYVIGALERILQQGKQVVVFADLNNESYVCAVSNKVAELIKKGYEDALEVVFSVQTTPEQLEAPKGTPQSINIGSLGIFRENMLTLN